MSKTILLKQAISEIMQASKKSCPFFFITGAGISYPSVPLAKTIIEHCKKEAKYLGRNIDDIDYNKLPAIDLYSRLFEITYPQRSQRQHYLKNLIKDKPLTKANLRLAHLLSSKKFANIVITPNFDDFLSRSLNLFETDHVLCDHPNTVERIDIESIEEIQIIHVHGTYNFYDCCNLRDEIKQRSVRSETQFFSMASILEQLLAHHSPLIIGYSGWDGDVILEALKKRLKNPLLNNLYWFCHKKDSMDSLPEEIRNNSDVRFVIPESKPYPTEGSAKDEIESKGIKPSGKKIMETSETESCLDADTVLKELINALNLEPPGFTRDPLGFFAKKLEISLFGEDDIEDIYYLKKIKNDIYEAKKLLGERAKQKEKVEMKLNILRDLMRSIQYKKAITETKKIKFMDYTTEKLQELFSLIWIAVTELNDNSEEELLGYDLVIKAGDILLKDNKALINDPKEPEIRIRLSKAFIYKGITLEELKKLSEAIEVYEDMIQRFGESKETEIMVWVAKAFVNKGFTLGEIGKPEEEIASYEDLFKRFGKSKNTKIIKQIARALFYKGFTLGVMGKHAEEIVIYEDFIKRFGESKEPEIMENVAKTLYNKGVTLGDMGKQEEEITAYMDLIKQFGESKETEIMEFVAYALFNKGATLGEMGKPEEEIAAYEDLIKRFNESKDSEIMEHVAKALFSKGFAFGKIDKSSEEIVVYEEVIKRFGESKKPEIMELVAMALYNKGATLGKMGKQEEQIAAYEDFIKRFGESKEPEIMKRVAKALYFKGVAFDKIEKSSEAIVAYEEVIKRFSESKEPEIMTLIAKANANKDILYKKLGKP